MSDKPTTCSCCTATLTEAELAEPRNARAVLKTCTRCHKLEEHRRRHQPPENARR